MSDLQWRRTSQAVACVDLVISFIAFFAVGAIISEVIIKSEDSADSTKAAFLITLLTTSVLVAIATCISTIAAIMLFTATKRTANPTDALISAKFWRNVNIGILLVTLLYYFLTFSFPMLIIPALLRLIGCYVVHQFIRELRQLQFVGSRKDSVATMSTDAGDWDATFYDNVALNIDS